MVMHIASILWTKYSILLATNFTKVTELGKVAIIKTLFVYCLKKLSWKREIHYCLPEKEAGGSCSLTTLSVPSDCASVLNEEDEEDEEDGEEDLKSRLCFGITNGGGEEEE